MANAPPLFVRRLRAALRRIAPGSASGIDGFVDGGVAGEIRGWAMDPRQPNRRVHVVAMSDGRVVAEALADQLRADLVQDGRGDGRHAFRLRLPAALLDGERRRIQVQAIVGGKAVRLLRGEVELAPGGADEVETAGPARSRPVAGWATAIAEAPPPPLALALWPSDSETSAPPLDWGVLGASGGRLVRLGRPGAEIVELAGAHTVVFARAGDQLDPRVGVLLQRSRPLSDVITWDGRTEASCRPEAKPLGLLLGESLGGAFALRGHAFALMGQDFAQALVQGDIRRAELLLAGQPALRWTHLPGRVTEGPAGQAVPSPAPAPEGLEGFRWAEPQGGRPGRLIPKRSPDLLTIAIWPKWGPGAETSLRSLLAQALPDVAVEVLAPASGADRARALADAMGLGGGSGLSVRAVDTPQFGTPGAWLAALASCASGEAVIVCQAGVSLRDDPGALAEIAAWACSPMAGAVTAPIRRGGKSPLAGLALERSAEGWRARSAHSQALDGLSRPVLAAPASFLAIGRDKLAMLGEPAAQRLPAGGVDLDLGLRLRRLGLPSVLLGGLAAESEAAPTPAGEIHGVPLAAFDPDELAAAAAAYPAPRD